MKFYSVILLLAAVFIFTSASVSVKAKDCSHVKKLHEKLICKAGSEMYDGGAKGETSEYQKLMKKYEKREKKEAKKNKAQKNKNMEVAFYEHGMSLTIVGDYFSLLNYVKSLDKIKEKLFVSEFQYKVIEYPKAELKLVIATVSANDKFIAL